MNRRFLILLLFVILGFNVKAQELEADIGYNFAGSGRGDLTYSVALGANPTGNTGVYIETYGELIEFDSLVSKFDSGLTYLVKENLQLDLSFGFGINEKMNYFSGGFTWNMDLE